MGHTDLYDIRDMPRLEEFGDLIGETINEDVVAAINAAPEPDYSTVIEEVEEVSDAGDNATTNEPEMLDDEVELESSGSDQHE